MGFSLGLIGLPNAGKSTIFNALTGCDVPAENYPFCTVGPNVGMAPVPDERLEKLNSLFKPQKLTPTHLEFIDVAGLVKGASQGEGLGNQFLSNIRGLEALAHVVRCFEEASVAHISTSVDPREDTEAVNLELIISDTEIVERRLDKLGKLARTGDKKSALLLEEGRKMLEGLHRGLSLRDRELTAVETELAREWQLLTVKPMIYIANLGEEQGEKGYLREAITELGRKQGLEVIEIYGQLEAELAQISDREERELLRQEMGLDGSGLEKLVRIGYNMLQLITFFTVVGEELRAWTISRGATAVEAAGKIHSDMARGFIKAEVIDYESLMAAGDMHRAREEGSIKIEGKDYLVQDGDILHIKFHH